MYCQLCHRPLSNSTSIIKGIGPTCINKLRPESESDPRSRQEFPFDGNIICKRGVENKPLTNINQLYVRHSPTGFEWGYGGSGPADFALNILLHFTCLEIADILYQQFKAEVISTLPFEGGVIEGTFIHEWIFDKLNQQDLFGLDRDKLLKKKPFANEVVEIMKIKMRREKKERVKKEQQIKKKKRKVKKERKPEKVQLLNKSVDRIRKENKARFVIVISGSEDEFIVKASNGKMSKKLKKEFNTMLDSIGYVYGAPLTKKQKKKVEIFLDEYTFNHE